MGQDNEMKFDIDGEQWIVRINLLQELSFAYLVPYERSIYATNPLWFDWGENENAQDDFYENYLTTDTKSHISIFKIKAKLMETIVDFVKKYQVRFFYYRPNTIQKFVVYSMLANQLKKN